MKKLVFLGIGAAFLLSMPVHSLAVPLEGHFSGKADHNAVGSGPGVYTVGETWTAYLKLDSVQPDPPGTWYPWNTGVFEYTMVITATVSNYVDASPSRTVDFSPATFAIYEDATTPAVYASKSTFSDGAAVLTGTISNMHGSFYDFGPFFVDVYNVNGDLAITGGTGMANATLCEPAGFVMNDFISHETPFGMPALWPDANGYEEGYDVKWDCEPLVTGTEQSTWGRIKAQYE